MEFAVVTVMYAGTDFATEHAEDQRSSGLCRLST